MNWIIALLGLSWFSAFTSQSLVDLSDFLVVVTALFMAFKSQEWKKLFLSFKPAWLWPLWIVIIIIGLILNTDLRTRAPWQDFLEFRWILTFLSWIYLLQILKDHRKVLKILACLTLVLNIAAFGIWLSNPDERAGGILGSVMSFAHNLAPIFCLYVILTLTNWKKLKIQERVLYSATTLTAGGLVIITFTRGVWIGSVVALFITAFMWNRKVFAALMGSLVIVFLIGVSTSERFANRVFTKTSLETQSNQERKALWRGNWEMVKDYPIFGVGLGANKSHLRKYYDIFGYPETQRQSHAHNQYLQYWAGTGTLGLICFLSFLYLILKYSYQGYRNNRSSYLSDLQLGLLAALICFLVGALTESNFNIAKNRFFFLILAGMAVAWNHSGQEKSDLK